eukprot:362192-Chlamydomonas_euryale.AAC.1
MGRASCGPVAAAQWLAAAAAAVCCSEEVHGAKEGISARSGTPQQPSRGDDHEWRCQQRQRSDAQQHLVHLAMLVLRAGGAGGCTAQWAWALMCLLMKALRVLHKSCARP